MRNTLLLLALTAACFARLASAQIANTELVTRNALVTVTNNTGQSAACLVLALTTAGNLALPPANVIAPGCPTPQVQIQGGQITINWGTACVPDGATVYLIVQSSRRRMLQPGQTFASLWASLQVAFAGGFWTAPNGSNIGNLSGSGGPNAVVIIDLGGNGPGSMGPCVITFTTTYVPRGPTICGPLMPPQGNQRCWTRKCWTAPADCLITIRKNGVPVISNQPTGFSLPGMEVCLRVTNPPAMPEEPPTNSLTLLGAPPEETPFGAMGASYAGYNTPSGYAYLSYRSDANGAIQSERGLPVLFDEVFARLELRVPDDGGGMNDPVDGSYAAMIAKLGPMYVIASTTFVEMADYLTAQQQATGDARYGTLASAALSIRTTMCAIGASMMVGSVTHTQDFAGLESALRTFGATLASFEAVPADSHAQANLIAMANGVRRAKEMVAAVLDDPLEQDFFLWGMQNRLNAMFRHLADALLPHTRIKVDLGPRGWFPSTIQGVLVRVQDADTNALLQTSIMRLSDRFEFDVPAYPGRNVRVWFKAPSFVSEVVQVANGTTYVVAGLSRCGDADGDNDVDLDDLDFVLHDQGAGGLQATTVPCTDLNADGLVDFQDLSAVWNNLGQVGAALL